MFTLCGMDGLIGISHTSNPSNPSIQEVSVKFFRRMSQRRLNLQRGQHALLATQRSFGSLILWPSVINSYSSIVPSHPGLHTPAGGYWRGRTRKLVVKSRDRPVKSKH